MKKKVTLLVRAVLVGFVLLAGHDSTALAQYPSRQDGVVVSSTNVLNEFMTLPSQGIPRSMLEKAQGIVIVPGMIKVGFVAGVRRGKGIVVVRDEQGAWRPPAFVTMTGGSVGWQVGVQSTDVILVFNSRNSVNNLLSGKFTIGVDAAAAAGPVGRQASAGTDGRLQAEIYSYSRSRGLFVGASVDGSVIEIDGAEAQAYYQAAGLRPDGSPLTANAQLPPSAARFLATLSSLSGSAVSAPGLGVVGAPAMAANSVSPPGVVSPLGARPTNEILPPAPNAGPKNAATNAPQDSGDPLVETRRALAKPRRNWARCWMIPGDSTCRCPRAYSLARAPRLWRVCRRRSRDSMPWPRIANLTRSCGARNSSKRMRCFAPTWNK